MRLLPSYFKPTLYLLTPLLSVPALHATEPNASTASNNTPAIERIQVTGTTMQSPSEVIEDTKIPRQPLPAHDGADYLGGITGFNLIRKGGASSEPVFRGLAGSRVAILSDGEPLLGGCESRMDPPTAYISPQSYDNIVVIKGPQQVSSGPPAAAATVNFERAQADFSEQALQGFLSLTGGRFGRAETNAEVQTGNQQGYIRGNYTFARSDNYKDGDNQSVHSAYKRWNSQLTMGYHFTPKQTLTLSLGTGDGESAYADRMMDGSSFYRENAALRWQYDDVSAKVSKLQARAYYGYIDHIMDNYSLREFIPQEHGHDHGSMPSAHNPDRYTRGFSGFIQLEPQAAHQLQLGLDGMQNTHRDRMSMDIHTTVLADEPRVVDAKIEQFGIYLEGRTRLSEQQTLHYGYRFDHWKAEDLRDFLDMMHTAPNPTAGESRSDKLQSGFVRYEHTQAEQTYYIGLGQATRFPDYWEMIARGRQLEHSASAFHIRPETLRQLDIGFMGRSAAFAEKPYQYSFNYFLNHIENYILIEHTSTAELSRNVDTQSHGFEFDGQLTLTAEWELTASLSYVRGKNKTDQLALAQQPPLQARLGLNYQLERWNLGGQIRTAQAQHRLAPHQGTIAGLDSTSTAGYAVTALNASWQASSALQVHFGVDNLLNKQYAEHLSRNAAAIGGYPSLIKVPEPGRNYWAYLSYRL